MDAGNSPLVFDTKRLMALRAYRKSVTSGRIKKSKKPELIQILLGLLPLIGTVLLRSPKNGFAPMNMLKIWSAFKLDDTTPYRPTEGEK